VEPPPPWLLLLYFAAQNDFVDIFAATSAAHHDACHIGVSVIYWRTHTLWKLLPEVASWPIRVFQSNTQLSSLLGFAFNLLYNNEEMGV
jgi:hypothetical protein